MECRDIEVEQVKLSKPNVCASNAQMPGKVRAAAGASLQVWLRLVRELRPPSEALQRSTSTYGVNPIKGPR